MDTLIENWGSGLKVKVLSPFVHILFSLRDSSILDTHYNQTFRANSETVAWDYTSLVYFMVAQMSADDWECQKMIDEYRSLSAQIRSQNQQPNINAAPTTLFESTARLGAQSGQAFGKVLGNAGRALEGVPSAEERLMQLDQSIRQDCVNR